MIYPKDVTESVGSANLVGNLAGLAAHITDMFIE